METASLSSKIKMKKQHIVCDRLEFHCGDHIDNDYKVEKLLGAGTFGCVYKVEGSDGTPYALKASEIMGDTIGRKSGAAQTFRYGI